MLVPYIYYNYTRAQPTNQHTQLEIFVSKSWMETKTYKRREEQIFSWQLDIKYDQIYYEELIS